METETNEKQLIYSRSAEWRNNRNEIPKQIIDQFQTEFDHISRKDFNKYINPHLSKPKKVPKPKLSFYKIFNYILYVLILVSPEKLARYIS